MHSSKCKLALLALSLLVPLTLSSCTAKADPDPDQPKPEPAVVIPADQQYASAKLAEMTLEEKVGQMFFVRCPSSNAAADAATYHLGGYLLFARDFKTKSVQKVTANIKSYQDAAAIPLFIGVDEEGGTVTRVSSYPQFRSAQFKSPRQIYAAGGWDGIKSDTLEKCELLSALGININFAPVCDVARSKSDFIYKRSFSTDADQISEFVNLTVSVMNDNNMGSVLKHFPGYGNNSDTHKGIAYDSRSRQTFDEIDFLPFAAGIQAGASMVMVSHNIVKCMDASAPASLSLKVHQILRSDLGYQGVIITDDLAMEGITDFAGTTDAAILAVLAGNDMLCCNNYKTAIPAVIQAVKDGTIPEVYIDSAVIRILKLKYNLGLTD